MSRILKNVRASAKRLHDAGYMDNITMRKFDALCLPPLHNYSPADVRRVREATKASQAVFAAVLNVGTTTLSAWEEGTKKPSGAAVKLIDLVERKGLGALA